MKLKETFYKFLSKLLNCCAPNDSVVDYVWEDFKYISVENQGLSTKTLLDCTVMSSHNSTIDKFQIFGTSNLNVLLEAINLNFRMIELDIFHDEQNEPVVSHGRKDGNLQVTSSVSFKDCIRLLSNYSMKCTDLPMIITLEINTDNDHALSRVNEIISEFIPVNDILVKMDTELKDIPLKDLTEKFIILCNNSKINNFPVFMHNYPDTHEYTFDPNELTRIYPDNVFLSTNYDYSVHLPCNFISMNVGYRDQDFMNYLYFFNGCGIKIKKVL